MKSLNTLNLNKLSHLEIGQFIKRNLEDLGVAKTDLKADANLQAYTEKLKAAVESFDQAIIQIKKLEETEVLTILDTDRDKAFAILKRQIDVFELSDVKAESDAFHSLEILLENYKDLPRLNYEAESNAIVKLLSQFSEQKYAGHAKTLNLDKYLERLKKANEIFNATFSQRSSAIAATVVYDAKAIRETINEHYRAYSNYVLALANATDSTYYNNILNTVNQVRKYFSDLLAKRNTKPDGSLV
jgi:hypothetical protein